MPDPSPANVALADEFGDLIAGLVATAYIESLMTLSRHAAEMDNHDVLSHGDDCAPCSQMILLSRVVDFGRQLRERA